MNKNNTIVVLDDDHYLLALLRGYCCAGNIDLEYFGFDRKGITYAEQLEPDVVVVLLESLFSAKYQLETDLLKELSSQGKSRILALNNYPSHSRAYGFLDWIDAIIENPHDIGEIDAYLKSINLSNNYTHAGDITYKEKRLGTDRRQIKIIGQGSIFYSDRRSNGDRRSCLERRNSPESTLTNENTDQLFNIDLRKKCLYVKGQKVELTPKEFELLLFLSTDVERVFTTDEIINHLWPESHRATKSDLYQYMHLLRKKIEPDPNSPQWIRNIKGFGYQLDIGRS